MRKKIIVRAPILTQSGYGEQARFAVRALRSKEELFDIYITPISWGETGWQWEDTEERRWIDKIITKTAIYTQQDGHFDMSLQVTIPNEWQSMAPVNIGYTAGIETTKVAPDWINRGNNMDNIIVVSNHSKETYNNTKYDGLSLSTNIDVVNYAYREHEPESIDGFELDYNFNYLIVSQWGPRKNMPDTLRWWIEEFIDRKVGLVLKTNIKNNSHVDREYLVTNLKSMLKDYPDRKCKIYLLHSDLSDGQMTWLYSHPKIKSLINIGHGEGFGLPMFEAAYNELPVISLGWSGQLDFLYHNGKNYFADVKYTLQPVQREAVWNGVVQADSMWAFADQGSYKMKLRDMYKKHAKYKTKAKELKKIIKENFSEEKMFEQFCNAVYTPDPEMQEWESALNEVEEL
tara:strand:+ start:1458 stop:2663 length:1206 start_codon:yes stop_codon:yes gene_type:complete